MNNPFGYSKTKLNWIVSDVNILYRDNVEEMIEGHVLGVLQEALQSALRIEVMEYNRGRVATSGQKSVMITVMGIGGVTY